MANSSAISRLIKEKAKSAGFDFCGISKADFLEEEAHKLEQWLKNGFQGQMGYMERNYDMRLDPRKLVPGAKSVVSFMANYFPSEKLKGENVKISKYAYGDDYHSVLKKKLKTLFAELQEQIGEFNGRVFTDSAPIMERVWASRSGLGWNGKNTLTINPRAGSFFFLAELICDLDLEPDGPIKDYCGTCTRCIDACPTEAIVEPFLLDAKKCISYLTIELKEAIPLEFKEKMEGWAFGCDICQDVCPWNRFSKPHQTKQFEPSSAFKEIAKNDFKEITEEVFNTLFKNSPIKRTKWEGFKRNLLVTQTPSKNATED